MAETSDKIDMSLDDIIRKNRFSFGNKRRGSGRGGTGRGFRRPFSGRFNNSGQQSSSAVKKSFGRNRPQSSATNGWTQRKPNAMHCRLHVSNLAYSVTDDDLYELFASFGPLKKSTVHYDQFGQSLGTAELVFEMRFDAIKAVKQYNGVPLDGRPMRIRLIGDKISEEWPNSTPRGAGRGSGRGGRGGGAGRQRLNVTAEDLDRDIDTWRMETE